MAVASVSTGGLAQYLLRAISNQSGSSPDSAATTTATTTADNGQAKLATLLQSANQVQQQTDAALKAGRSDQAGDLVGQATAVVSGLETAVKSASDSDTSSSSGLSAANKASVSSILNVLNGTLAELSALVPKGGGDASSAINTTIGALQDRATALARQAGIGWQIPSVSTVVTGISGASSHLVDMYA